MSDFRDDLKKVYRLCGVEGKQVAFILTDSQIVCESFVEDVSNILNSGDVPGELYSRGVKPGEQS